MKKLRWQILVCLLLLFAAALPAFARDAGEGRSRRHRPSGDGIRPNSLHFVRVVRVVDGDTVMVAFTNGGKPERVRLIGVNTPESVRPDTPVQEYAKEASEYTTTMLSNRDVWLQFDVGLRDRHRRLLAYLWTERPQNLRDEEEVRGQMFNARLLLEGYAQTMTIQPNSRYARMFAKFQREARENNRGLWWRH